MASPVPDSFEFLTHLLARLRRACHHGGRTETGYVLVVRQRCYLLIEPYGYLDLTESEQENLPVVHLKVLTMFFVPLFFALAWLVL